MRYNKPNKLYYRIAQIASWFFATFIFRRKVLRNEIRHAKGPFVVIANHQAAYDFVNLIGMTWRPMSFVISNSFYQSLPITGFLKKMGVIPKQQFQTTVSDMKNMKAVVDAGEALAIYPAGLMCEDGLPTPVPAATYKFLKWLGVDVYVARTTGTYFVMPKWGRGMRSGKTFLDVYKLISAEELAHMDVDTVREKVDQALSFDAYRDQEEMLVRYHRGDDIRGLENVLYTCPACGQEFTVSVKDRSTIFCVDCGFAHKADDRGFLHNVGNTPEEIRYASDWSRMIQDRLEDAVRQEQNITISAETKVCMIDYRRHAFREVGEAVVTLDREAFHLDGTLFGVPFKKDISIVGLPTLPFSPGKYFEIQDGKDIYRCVLSDGRQVTKFINLVKIFYRLNHRAPVKMK